MAPNPELMRSIERLNYRATVGDVATQAGLKVNVAEQGLLALAADAGGHLQVAESGEVVYQFPQNFRTVLRNKHFQLQLKEWWEKVWRVLFYLIRLSFGVLLLGSIALIAIAIVVILTALSSDRDSNDRGDGGMVFLPNVWFGPDLFWIFYPNYYDRPVERRRTRDDRSMNFLEAVFSFLFGDGNPNRDLETRRWQTIGATIRNHRGAIVAEQVAPYLDDLGQGHAQEYEEYMLPVLTRFNGRPEVSPTGGLVYQFPELQTSADEQRSRSVPAYLKEILWRFSKASPGQLILAAALGGVNLVGALALGKLLAGGVVAAKLSGLIAFVQSIYWLLLAYGIGFLLIPLGRYFWVQWRNGKLADRNAKRQARVERLLQPDTELQAKLAYAEQFAAATVITQADVVYSSDRDLLEQDLERSQQIDAEWQRRLDQQP